VANQAPEAKTQIAQDTDVETFNLGQSFKELVKKLTFPGVTTGLIGATFSASVGLTIIVSVAKAGKLPENLAISWIFAIFVFAGLGTMFMALRYRTPVVVAWSIPGAVIIGKYFQSGGTINNAIGTYFAISIAVLILTFTGAIKWLVDRIPVSIMLAMVAGVLFSYGLGAFSAGLTTPAVYGVMIIVFFAWQYFKSLSSRIPSVVVAALVGVVLLIVLGKTTNVPVHWQIAHPVLVRPGFSFSSMLTLGVPLFFMVVGVQNIQAIGVLLSRGYKPPVNAMYVTPAILSFFNGLFGGHTAVTAGPSTAIVSSEMAGPKEIRWVAAFFEGLFWVGIGLLAEVGVNAAKLVPPEFMLVVAGLAMFDVFISAFGGAFARKFKKGAMVAFFVAAANVSLLKVGSPFWAIVAGVVVALLTERDDFKASSDEGISDKMSLDAKVPLNAPAGRFERT
jgi:benzoate membrane transport protein